MNKIWAILPIKASALSKSRLAPLLNESECVSLSRAMMLDVIEALNAAKLVDQVAVVTTDPETASLAREQGCLIMLETVEGLNENLNVVARGLQEKMINGILIVPGDIPTITPACIDELIRSHNGGISICAAGKDNGTNALLCTPPAAIPFQYGKNSADHHQQKAAEMGVKYQRQFLGNLLIDIDEPDDLRWMANRSLSAQAGIRTSQYLIESGISERLLRDKLVAKA